MTLHYDDSSYDVLEVLGLHTKSLDLSKDVVAVEINSQTVNSGQQALVQLPSLNWINTNFTNTESLELSDY